jgi:hypothetical protein
MASPVTLSSSLSVAQTNSSVTGQTTSYLDRCIEDLSHDKVVSSEKKANHWQIISIVSTVAFFALSIGAFIATSILFPAHMPIAGIGALLLALPTVQQIQKFQEWAQAAQYETEKYKAIQHNYSDLTRQLPLQLQQTLLYMGINWNQIPGMQNPANLSRLNPLLAQAKYLEQQTDYWLKERDKNIDAARLISSAGATPGQIDQKLLFTHRALRYEHQALQLKIQNAFTNAVLRNPDFKGSLENLGTLSKITYQERLFGNALNDPTSNQILSLNHPNLAPITFDEVKTMTVAALGQRIFAAMTSQMR